MFPVEPAGDDGGDEELGAIAVFREVAVSIEFFEVAGIREGMCSGGKKGWGA